MEARGERIGVARVPAALAAALAIAYLVAAPASADLAAQEFRAWLFDHAGPVLWDNNWYGGHPTMGYSVLFPPLGALLGVRLAGALSVVASAALFTALVRRSFGATQATAIGATWFGAGVALQLLTGRMAFLFGLAVGLGALLAAQRGRRVPAGLLAAATTLASPVAGAFLALAGVAWAVATRTRPGLILAGGASAAMLVLAALFPETGTEPFVASAFWPSLIALAALAVFLPAEQRVLRVGAAALALACLAAFVLPSPVGGNVTRLAALTAGPLLACIPLTGRRRMVVLLAAPLLLYWQLMPPVRDAAVAAGDPSTSAAYYAPLLDELRPRLASQGIYRVEVPFTRTHWEARFLGERVPLARGWQRQLDRAVNPLFYDDRLTADRLGDWLRRNGVRWVALPDVRLDHSALREAALLRAGVPGVREVYNGEHWTLYEVARARPMAVGAGRLTALEADAFTLTATRPGRTVVRVRWSPYWDVAGTGCVARAANGWTVVDAPRAGRVRVAQRFSLGRGLRRSTAPRCTP